MINNKNYMMENDDESIRLEIKTNPAAVRDQALWCGIKPGMRLLDAGCGPGIVTSILKKLIEPGGEIIGLDYSDERIRYANNNYNNGNGIEFRTFDLREPLENIAPFDLIWVRFVLEYNKDESFRIVENLTKCLKPGGWLCLMDLDYNCLTHFELPTKLEQTLLQLTAFLELNYNFDPYSGRKLYSYLYDLGYEQIDANIIPHHLFYGELKGEDIFNWIKKVEVLSKKAENIFTDYPGGKSDFFKDFKGFFLDPRRFTYTPLIICKGSKPE